jgi:hypothetical protein
MDAVLPLLLRDLPRFELLYRSLRRHVRGLDRVLVVVPDRELEQVRAGLPRGELELVVLPEFELVPELRVLSRLPGWYRQQLVKLEAATRVRSDFYLTLDADLIATRPVNLEEVCAGGTAPCAVTHQDLHPRWYAGAEALIGGRLPRQGISHAVTPTILHREAVNALTQHLDQRWTLGRYSAGLRGLKQRLGHAYVAVTGVAMGRELRGKLRPWRLFLSCSRPWSEYSLYYSFLEWSGHFERYHHETAEALYAPERSIWYERDLPAFRPGLLGLDGPPFVVLQSTAGIPLDTLRAWVEPFV